MIRLLLSVLIIAAGVQPAFASTIIFSSTGGGRAAVDASSTPLPDGRQVLVGRFSNPGGISLSAGSAANILASGGWSQFDGALTTGSIFGTPGKLIGQTQDNTASANAFNLQTVYVVVFNTTTTGTATQMGIFTDPTAVGIGVAAWTFPSNTGGVGDSTTLDMNHTGFVSVGSVGTVVGSGNGSQFKLTALVPEPSAVALLIPGVIGLLGYRRLRRHS